MTEPLTTIIQVAYEVPKALDAALRTGEAIRFGSVIRQGAGITTHLKEVPLPTAKLPAGSVQKLAAVLTTKTGSIAVVGLGALVGGVAAYLITRPRKEPETVELPVSVVEYNAAVAAYLESVRAGQLTEAHVDRLLASLDDIEHAAHASVIEFSRTQAKALVGLIEDYTRQLAAANSFEIDEAALLEPGSLEESLVGLRHYLLIQKQIFNSAG